METILRAIPPMHPEGMRFVFVFAFITAVLFWLWQPLGWIGVILTGWCYFFFRNPERVTPGGDDILISPADGMVEMITRIPAPPELEMGGGGRVRISIFMNVFNVHVNRVPASGVITKLVYVPGKFLNASLDKASEHNERQLLAMKMADGSEIAFVQIAGLVARRILCWVKEGQNVAAGERFGLIRFGSRVDIYLDSGLQPAVKAGQTMIAGETVIARKG